MGAVHRCAILKGLVLPGHLPAVKHQVNMFETHLLQENPTVPLGGRMGFNSQTNLDPHTVENN